MKEINEKIVKKMVDKIYKDAMVTNSNDYFLKLKYNYKHFKKLIENKDIFHSIICYLPNSIYKGMPFVMSVVYNKNSDEYEVLVKNPRVKV